MYLNNFQGKFYYFPFLPFLKTDYVIQNKKAEVGWKSGKNSDVYQLHILLFFVTLKCINDRSYFIILLYVNFCLIFHTSVFTLISLFQFTILYIYNLNASFSKRQANGLHVSLFLSNENDLWYVSLLSCGKLEESCIINHSMHIYLAKDLIRHK